MSIFVVHGGLIFVLVYVPLFDLFHLYQAVWCQFYFMLLNRQISIEILGNAVCELRLLLSDNVIKG